MISYTAFEATVPVFIRGLQNVQRQLEKAEAYCLSRNADSAKLLQDKIAFDQFPLVRQVQIVTDTAKKAAGLLAGIEIPKYEDTEVTMAEVSARIEKTIAFLQGISAAQMTTPAEKIIPMYRTPTQGLPLDVFITHHALPNFFFHATIAYEIMRKNGVELGKADFLGTFTLTDITADITA